MHTHIQINTNTTCIQLQLSLRINTNNLPCVKVLHVDIFIWSSFTLTPKQQAILCRQFYRQMRRKDDNYVKNSCKLGSYQQQSFTSFKLYLLLLYLGSQTEELSSRSFLKSSLSYHPQFLKKTQYIGERVHACFLREQHPP